MNWPNCCYIIVLLLNYQVIYIYFCCHKGIEHKYKMPWSDCLIMIRKVISVLLFLIILYVCWQVGHVKIAKLFDLGIQQHVKQAKKATFYLLTLYLLVSSADIFFKQFGPRSGPTNVRPDLVPIWLTLRWYSWKDFSKKLIWKKISRRQKSMKNFPGCKELIL